MNAYVDLTRPVFSFVEIGIALRDYANATVHQILGTPQLHQLEHLLNATNCGAPRGLNAAAI